MSLKLSDFNERGSKSSNVSRETVYRDLDLSFNIHPTTNDIKPVLDITAVKNSISNLVQTSFLERPFHPEIGAGIRALLFEPVDLFTALSLKDSITTVISEFEPRVKNVTVQIQDDSERNAYVITIGFVVFNNRNEQFELYLSRLR
jgi:phage baseplate assembly protein W